MRVKVPRAMQCALQRAKMHAHLLLSLHLHCDVAEAVPVQPGIILRARPDNDYFPTTSRDPLQFSQSWFTTLRRVGGKRGTGNGEVNTLIRQRDGIKASPQRD